MLRITLQLCTILLLRASLSHNWSSAPPPPFPHPRFLETRGAATSYGALSALPHREMRFYTLRAVLHSGGNRPACIKQINYLPVYHSCARARARIAVPGIPRGGELRSPGYEEEDGYAYAWIVDIRYNTHFMRVINGLMYSYIGERTENHS